MPRGASPQRERQYEHIRESELERGENPKRATEIAARTVNKERARTGEARTASKTSTQDISDVTPDGHGTSDGLMHTDRTAAPVQRYPAG